MVRRNRTTLLVLAVWFLLSWAGVRAGAAGLDADMVIYNGKILTADSPDPNNFRTAQAAAIYDGKFIAVGTNEEALQYAGPKTQKIDLGGRTVVPGLVETHHHTFGYASHFFPDGRPPGMDPPVTWTNKAEFLEQVRTLALRKKPGEWIITTPRGGDEAGGMGIVAPLQTGEVTRFDLDKVAPNNPVAITWIADSEGLVNSKALEFLLARYPNTPGVRRDARGVPTGRIAGLPNWTVLYEIAPKEPPEQLAPYYKMELEESAATGLTTLSTRLSPEQLTAYAWLRARGELPTRLAYTSQAVARNPGNVDGIFSRLAGMQGGSGKTLWGAGDDQLWLIGMAASFHIDHVPGIAGSCVNKAYPREAVNFPLWRYQFYGPYGLCILDNPEYNDREAFWAAAKYGFRTTAMHTGGDRGIDQFLSLMEEIAKQYPDVVERRWGIDHCRFLNEEEARRAQKLGIIFSCGPKYVYAGERGDIGAYKILYGEEVAADVVVPLRRLLNNGLRTTIELDEHGFHPLLALEVAVNRKDVNGKAWGPQQRVNRREALYMYTRWGAEYVIKENLLGSVEPGKHADFAVLNRDYLTVPEDEIGQIDPVLTVVGGKISYTDPPFASNQGLPQVGYRGDRSWWKRGIPADLKIRGGGGGG